MNFLEIIINYITESFDTFILIITGFFVGIYDFLVAIYSMSLEIYNYILAYDYEQMIEDRIDELIVLIIYFSDYEMWYHNMIIFFYFVPKRALFLWRRHKRWYIVKPAILFVAFCVFWLIYNSAEMILKLIFKFLLLLIRIIRYIPVLFYRITHPGETYAILKFLFLKRFINYLEMNSWYRYVWKKYDITYNRLVNYPRMVWIQYVLYSAWDMFAGAPNSYYSWIYPRSGDFWFHFHAYDKGLIFTTMSTSHRHILNYTGVAWTELIQTLDSAIIAIFLVYHCYFWFSLLFFKRMYVWMESYMHVPEMFFIALFMIHNYQITSKIFFSIETWYYSIWTYTAFLVSAFMSGVSTSDENEAIYEVINMPDEWQNTLWQVSRLYSEVERYQEGATSDMIWELREVYRLNVTRGYDEHNCKEKYLLRMEWIQKQMELQGKGDINGISRAEVNKMVTNLKKERDAEIEFESWKHRAKHENPFGYLDTNEFALFGLAEKLFGQNLRLPFDVFWFSEDFKEMTLVPLYLFLKNPYWTLLYWDAPLLMRNYFDSGPQVRYKISYNYLEIMRLQGWGFEVRRMSMVCNQYYDFHHQQHIGQYNLGTRKLQFNGRNVYWVNMSFYGGTKLFYFFKLNFYRLCGYDYDERRAVFKYRMACLVGFWKRYTLVELIFCRKRIRKMEFLHRVEVEELMRRRALRIKGINNIKSLKTRNYRDFH